MGQIRRRFTLALAAVGAASLAAPAWASTIVLSSDSSSPGVDPAVLDATLTFEVTGSTLILSVSNDTSDLDIAAIYLNAPTSVGGLTIGSAPSRWRLEASIDTGAFGVFDFALTTRGNQARNDGWDAGGTAEFVLNIQGSGPFEAADFTREGSAAGAGEASMFAAALFENGSTSAIGGGASHMPEPATALLLTGGLGALALVGRRRRA